MRFQTSPCFKMSRRSPSTARISVAESKSSKESKLLASRYAEPTSFDFDPCVALWLEEQPVKPSAAKAEPNTVILKKLGNKGCHKITVGLYIKKIQTTRIKFIF